MAILNAAIYLNHSRVFGWQVLKSVMPTDAYNTIFHNAVLPSVVDDVKDRISIERLQSCLGCYVGKNKEQLDNFNNKNNSMPASKVNS